MAVETIGYPSRVAAVTALAEAGKSPEAIAEMTGLSLLNVRVHLSHIKKRRRVRRKKLVGTEYRQAVWLDRRVVDALRPAADARRMPVTELVRDILATIVEDGITDGVLDDGIGLGS